MPSLETTTCTDAATNGTQDPYKMVDPNSQQTTPVVPAEAATMDDTTCTATGSTQG